MGNNQHLKRSKAPFGWPVKRKNITFVAKPNPGSYSLKYVVPVVVVLRDILKYTSTAKEAKYIVYEKGVLVNGKKVSDINHPVGIFDVFEITASNEKFLVTINQLGKFELVKCSDDLLYLRISGKQIRGTESFQLNFMNGYNRLVDKKVFDSAKVNDTVVLDFKKNKIEKVLPLKEGSFAFFYDGKLKGQIAEIKGFNAYNGITRDVISVESADGTANSTAKDYAYVVGLGKADVKRFLKNE